MALTTEQVSARIKELCNEEYLLTGIVPMATVPEPALRILIEESESLRLQVVALRSNLESVLKHEKWHAAMADEVTPEARESIIQAEKALSNTSATAQKVKESIEREALEKAWYVVDTLCANGHLNITRTEALQLREAIECAAILRENS